LVRAQRAGSPPGLHLPPRRRPLYQSSRNAAPLPPLTPPLLPPLLPPPPRPLTSRWSHRVLYGPSGLAYPIRSYVPRRVFALRIVVFRFLVAISEWQSVWL